MSALSLYELYLAMEAKRYARRLTWRAIARQLEIYPSNLTRLKQGKEISAENYIAFCDWLEEG